MRQKATELIDGKIIEYGGCLHNHIEIRLDWKNRIRAFFGKSVLVCVKNYTEEPVNCLATQTTAHTLPIVFYTFKSKKIKSQEQNSGSVYDCVQNVPLRRIEF